MGVTVLLLALSLLVTASWGSCPAACNFNGNCSVIGRCSCFSGWEGNDCGLRSCPMGYNVADIAYAKDSAHVLETCSGRGVCERATSTCICEPGWSGYNCGKSACPNGCSGRGQCISLGVASTIYDGYLYNHTTSYTRWDADTIYGCKCDTGYSGADCQERVCESGLDPRRATGTPHEIVTLVCTCLTSACGGKFKLRFLGSPIKTWLYPTSKAYEVANALMVTFGNSSLHAVVPVTAYNRTANDAVCPTKAGEVRRTRIKFRRNAGDVPAISFYGNLITSGSMYFETTQILSCDCGAACNGTFRVSFDGEMSSRLQTYANGSAIITALKAMKTIQSAGINGIRFYKNPYPTPVPTSAPSPKPSVNPAIVPTPPPSPSPTSAQPSLQPIYLISVAETTSICIPGRVNNHTYIFKAQAGNIPRIGLWSSVVGFKNPSYFNSVNATKVLTLKTNDGRDDNLKVCNGIGQCDFATGNCLCPSGYGLDPDRGPCAKLTPATSKFNGIGRCPGLVSISGNNFDGSKVDLSQVPSHVPRIYTSINPTSATSSTKAYVVYYDWTVSVGQFPNLNQNRRKFMFSMTTSTSAGPIVLDQAKERIFFVDANFANPFIGIALVNSSFNASAPYNIWARTSCNIFGFAFNANFNQRKLFWACPGNRLQWDGGIFYASVDDTSANVYNFGAVMGRDLADPMGLAFNYLDSKIYWLDHNIVDSSYSYNVLNSANLDGTGFVQTTMPITIGSHTLSLNLTDLVIDFRNNKTAFFLDAQYAASTILAITLDTQQYYNTTIDSNSNLFAEMVPSRILASTITKWGNPKYMVIDDATETLFWSDAVLQKVSYTTYAVHNAESSNYSYVYSDQERVFAFGGDAAYPVGLCIDDGLSVPTFDGFLECYGNGICLGAASNFECQCFDGFFGDCRARMCPKGPAWFNKPYVDDIAHDIHVECSNVGHCDRSTGVCTCPADYDGAACDRLMCPGETDTDHYCSGNGRCLSMRELALKHKDKSLDRSYVVSYGSTPRNPATWDADMIYGCIADEYGYYMGTTSNITAYKGYKSHRRECPYAFDNRDLQTLTRNTTYNQITFGNNGTRYQMEIQQFACSATAGSFTLSFRGATTSSISYTSDPGTLQLALIALPTIGNVTVRMTSPASASTICAAVGNVGNITFSTELGLTPLLKVATSTLTGGTFSVSRLVKGKGFMFECSGKGDCDYDTGNCQCYDGHASSDGYGHFGTRGDCGRSSIR